MTTDTKAKRTPGPWTIEQFLSADTDDGQAVTAISAYANEHGKESAILATVNRWSYGDDPPTLESEANAQFIVHACNLHDELVDGCWEALSLLETNHKAWELKINGPTFVRLRALLAKVQEISL